MFILHVYLLSLPSSTWLMCYTNLDNTTVFNIYICTLRYDHVLNVTCNTTKGWRQLLLMGVSQPTSMNTVITGNQGPLTSFQLRGLLD